MTRPSATCELFVNGTRVPDTGDDLVVAQPTALDGLSLTWGRDGQHEQPGPATCSFVILDRFATSDFLDRLHVGSTVALWAQGEIDSGATQGEPTFDFNQSTFSSWPDGAPPDRALIMSGVVTVQSHQLELRSGATVRGSVHVPPRVFSPPGTLPNAWDDIQKFSAGESWTWTLRFKAPKGTTVNFYGSRYKDPYAASVSTAPIKSFSPSAMNGTGDWVTVKGKITFGSTPDSFGWFGIYAIAPFGGRWLDEKSTSTWAADTRTWAETDFVTYVDDFQAYAPPVTSLRVLAFSGAVTDVVATPFGNGDTLQLAVTAADIGADLGNRVIGDNPWPVQALSTRANRIAQLAGITSSPRVRVDAPLDALQVSYRDVDAQAAYALLQDLAQTGGGILWAATHAVTGQFLWIENPDTRVSLRELVLSGGDGSSAAVDAVNLCTNPSFTNDLTGWSFINNPQVYVISWQPTGGADGGARFASTRGTSTSQFPLCNFGTNSAARIPLSSGSWVGARLKIRASASITKLLLRFSALSSTGATLTLIEQQIDLTTPGVWGEYVATATLPTNVNTTYLGFYVMPLDDSAATWPNGQNLDLDQVIIVAGRDDQIVPAYFDGSTTATADHFYRWRGAVDASASERVQPATGTIRIIGATDDVTLLSACDLLEEPVSWRQDTADVSTVVAVTWLEQGVDDEGDPITTERTETVTDSAGVTTYGTRRLSISTELTKSSDAITLANRSLATSRGVPWRIEGLTFDTDVSPVEIESVDDKSREVALLNLLDGTTRMGLAITLVDMPSYAPHGAISDVYVEGGRYAYEQGAWTLALNATPSSGQGASAKWGQLDAAWTWAQWSTSLVWQDLYGVAP